MDAQEAFSRYEKKIIDDRGALSALSDHLRQRQKKITLTSGAFDLMHSGHPKYLVLAKSLGDVLIVGVDSDDLVKYHKGPKRPILQQQSRAFILACF